MTKSRGIQKPRHFYSWVETELVRRNYADSLTKDLATALGLSIYQVQKLAFNLGLKKSHDVKAKMQSELMKDPDHPGRQAGFKKGNVPSNKGVRRPGWSVGRMRETQFAKGQRPHTWKPIGSTRVNSDGYLDRKVTDTGYPPADWKAVHRLVWIAANGPIPAGYVVAFKQGQRTTVEAEITPDRLELLSKRQVLDSNSIHNLPPELRHVTILSGVLTRQINKLSKGKP